MQAAAQSVLRYLPILVMALAWELAARLNIVDSQALPPLTQVAVAWTDLIRDGELVNNGAASLYRGGMGLLAAVALGGSLGLCLSLIHI